MSDLRRKLEGAFAAHQSGQLQEAAAGYVQVLKADPRQPDALNLLGVIHSQQKDFDQSIPLLLRAIEAKPNFTDAWLNLAKTFRAMGRLEEGVGACDVVLRIDANHAEAHATRARLLRRLQSPEEAVESARRALALRPNDLEFAKSLASSLVAAKRYAQAETLYLQLKSQYPNDLTLANDLAMLWVEMGRPTEAMTLLEKLVMCDPPLVAACSNLANLLDSQGESARAMALHQKTLSLDPQFYPGWVNYANSLKTNGQSEQAREALERAISLRPERAEARVNLAGILMDAEEEAPAFAQLQEALRVSPRFADGWNNLGAMELSCARPERAVVAYLKALDFHPTLAAAHFGLAMAALMQGDFQRGWPSYEWRWLGASQAQPAERPRFSYPQWKGEPTNPQRDTLLVYHEQGFGDTVQFLRFVPGLEQRFARVVLILQPPLLSLARTYLPASIELLSSEEGTQFVKRHALGWHCPMGSLALALNITEPRMIPGTQGYLRAPDNQTVSERFQNAVTQARANCKPLIGICWAGNPALAHDASRSIKLEFLNDLIRGFDAQWVSLQRDRSEEESQMLSRWGVLDLAEDLQDFADTAKVMQSLDLIIAVDTVVVHLAGALGIPVWLLNRFQSEWRWMLGTQHSVWYASLRQFRQRQRKDWLNVLKDVGRVLPEHFHQT